MSIRLTVGILAFAALASASSATVLSYHVTGAFDEQTSTIGAQPFALDFAYDTEAANGSSDPTLAMAMLQSASWTIGGGPAVVADAGTIALSDTQDPASDFVEISASRALADGSQEAFLIHFSGLDLASLAFPSDLPATVQGGAGAGVYLAEDAFGFPTGIGAGDVSGIQAAPEPASLAALAVGGIGLLRRRVRLA